MKNTNRPSPALKVVKRYPDGRVRAIFGIESRADLKPSGGAYAYEFYARRPDGTFALRVSAPARNFPRAYRAPNADGSLRPASPTLN